MFHLAKHGQSTPINRAARRELDAKRRKATRSYTKRKLNLEREPTLLVEHRRGISKMWRQLRRAKEKGLTQRGPVYG